MEDATLKIAAGLVDQLIQKFKKDLQSTHTLTSIGKDLEVKVLITFKDNEAVDVKLKFKKIINSAHQDMAHKVTTSITNRLMEACNAE